MHICCKAIDYKDLRGAVTIVRLKSAITVETYYIKLIEYVEEISNVPYHDREHYAGVSDRVTIGQNDRRYLGTLALSLKTFE